MAELSKDDVLKLAQLARLDLADDEIDSMQGEINSILGYVESLQEVDVTGLEPTIQVGSLQNVMRNDEIVSYQATPDDLLKTAPNRQGRYLEVKRVMQ